MINNKQLLSTFKFSEETNKSHKVGELSCFYNEEIIQKINLILSNKEGLENISKYLIENKHNIIELINNSNIRKNIMKQDITINEFFEIIGLNNMDKILKNYNKSYNILFKSLFRKRNSNEGIIDVIKKGQGRAQINKIIVFDKYYLFENINDELSEIIYKQCFSNIIGLTILNEPTKDKIKK